MANDPTQWLNEELKELELRGLRRFPETRNGSQSPELVTWKGRQVVNFGSNDYLSIANDPRLIEAAKTALSDSGWGSGASPIVSGRSSWHAALEERIADFEGTEAALLFPSGFAANVATIDALVGRGDVVLSDAKNHASLIDGCRLSGARVCVYQHADASSVEKIFSEFKAARRWLIVTDSVFSMDGDWAPLRELARLANEHNAMLLLDEAHATGVFGMQGRGLAEELIPEEHNVIRIGTMSKALGGCGGFVTGSRKLIDFLANRARGYFFSTASPASSAAAGLAALEIVEKEPFRRIQLREKAKLLRKLLRESLENIRSPGERWPQIGLDGAFGESQIIPMIVGEAALAMRLSEKLFHRGFFVPGIRPPSVPPGESLLRISVSYGHSEESLRGLSEAIVAAWNEVQSESPTIVTENKNESSTS